MMAVLRFLASAIVVCTLLAGTSGLLDFDFPLPQYHQYGRSLVLVGGALQENNTEVYNTIVDMAGGKGKAKIGIISAASADPLDSYQYYRGVFLRLGVLEANRIPVDLNHTSANSDHTVVHLINQQTGFFFSGGDQQRIIDSFVLAHGHESPALTAIRHRFRYGAVVAGSSAGTACQPSAVMIRGGVSWNALRYGAYKTMSSSHPDDLVYNPDGGLGFLDNYVIDTHFSQRGREGRLIRLLCDTQGLHGVGTTRGFGVDENTALVVTHVGTNQEKGKVIGQNGVFFVDVSRAVVDTRSTYFSVHGVSAHYLTHGDEIGMVNMNITFSPTKSLMAGHENYDHALTTDDIFYGKSSHPGRKPEFVRVATSIFDARLDHSTYGDTYESRPRFRVTLSRSDGESEGWVARMGSFHTDITSYKNMHVQIKEH